MTDDEVAAALEEMVPLIREADRSAARLAAQAWAQRDLTTAHSLICDLAWTYWRSELVPPAQLHPLQEDLAARRRIARGAVGTPPDLYPPRRQGRLRG